MYPSHNFFLSISVSLSCFTLQSPLWTNCKSSIRRREHNRQVVQLNELNEAKQIMSECMSDEGYYSVFLDPWQVLPFPTPGQNTHGEYHSYSRIWKRRKSGKGNEAASFTGGSLYFEWPQFTLVAHISLPEGGNPEQNTLWKQCSFTHYNIFCVLIWATL